MSLNKAPNVTLTGAVQVVDISKTEPDPCAVKLQNESTYTLDITIGPDTHTLGAWTGDVFPMPRGVTSFTISPVSLTSATAPSAVLLVTTAAAGDVIPGTYPVALTRQAADYSPQIVISNLITGAGTKTLSVPPGTHSIWFLPLNASAEGHTIAGVTGHQSGRSYGTGIVSSTVGWIYGPAASGYDTSVDVVLTSALDQFAVIALLDPIVALVTGVLAIADSAGGSITRGQKTAALSLPVVLDSDTAGMADVSDRAARFLGTLSLGVVAGGATRKITRFCSAAVGSSAAAAWTNFGNDPATFTQDLLCGWRVDYVNGANAQTAIGCRILGATSGASISLDAPPSLAAGVSRSSGPVALGIPVWLPDVGFTAGEVKNLQYYTQATLCAIAATAYMGA